MVGRTLDNLFPKEFGTKGEVALKAEHLMEGGVLDDVSFEAYNGQVLGFAGLVGAGRTETMRAIFGADPLDSGKIFIHGKEVKIKTPRHAIQNGIAFLTEDRKGQGLVLQESIRNNVILANMKGFTSGLFLNDKKISEATEANIRDLRIKTPSADEIVGQLSGGNQQKVVIGKWLNSDSEIFIFDEPTRGIDVGAKIEVYNVMNALIKEGKCTISTAICTRDDIMTYLISKGMDNAQSFTIMESVRKGKGLKPEWEKAMREHDVPEWYIWSCKKIKYMFPKAHAAAYVMMAWRIAWFKIFQPLAYYAAFFSIRATAFNYEMMCLGRERLEYYLEDYKKRKDTLSKKEQDTLRDMRVVQEMYARGYEFVPVDLYKAQAHRFQIIDGKLMPALDTIDGLGDKAADAVVLAAMDGPFLSKDDFQNRTKVSKTVIALMDDLKIFGNLPQSNQISLFDFTA